MITNKYVNDVKVYSQRHALLICLTKELSFRTQVNDFKSVCDFILGTQRRTVRCNVVSVAVVRARRRYACYTLECSLCLHLDSQSLSLSLCVSLCLFIVAVPCSDGDLGDT
jgi:hypothetical protein